MKRVLFDNGLLIILIATIRTTVFDQFESGYSLFGSPRYSEEYAKAVSVYGNIIYCSYYKVST